MTRDELITRMVNRRLLQESITWAQFAQVVGNLGTAQKNNLMVLLNAGKGNDAGALLVGLVSDMRRAQARTYVDARAADDIWSTDDLLELLGD